MNTLSRILTGSILSGLGIFLLIFSIIEKENIIIFWIYGLPLLIIGILIFLNTKEDKIEKIKSERRLKKWQT